MGKPTSDYRLHDADAYGEAKLAGSARPGRLSHVLTDMAGLRRVRPRGELEAPSSSRSIFKAANTVARLMAEQPACPPHGARRGRLFERGGSRQKCGRPGHLDRGPSPPMQETIDVIEDAADC